LGELEVLENWRWKMNALGKSLDDGAWGDVEEVG